MSQPHQRPPEPVPPPARPHVPHRGACDGCGAAGVRLIDRPKPGDPVPHLICAVCDSKN